MRRQALKQSDLIQSIGYKDGKMEIKYASDGAVFIYSGVSKGLYEALKRSSNPGSEWVEIRDHYDHERIN